ncbi:hypothetical protein OROMI_012539 [Orobanche minor]
MVGEAQKAFKETEALKKVRISPADCLKFNIRRIDVDCHGNRLTGSIPANLGNMTNMELNGNLLIGNIPSELGMVESARCVSMLYSEGIMQGGIKSIFSHGNVLRNAVLRHMHVAPPSMSVCVA